MTPACFTLTRMVGTGFTLGDGSSSPAPPPMPPLFCTSIPPGRTSHTSSAGTFPPFPPPPAAATATAGAGTSFIDPSFTAAPFLLLGLAPSILPAFSPARLLKTWAPPPPPPPPPIEAMARKKAHLAS